MKAEKVKDNTNVNTCYMLINGSNRDSGFNVILKRAYASLQCPNPGSFPVNHYDPSDLDWTKAFLQKNRPTEWKLSALVKSTTYDIFLLKLSDDCFSLSLCTSGMHASKLALLRLQYQYQK